jgi:predicted deacetylase
MTARYLVRFDDICPTMNWRVWGRIEALLERHGVKPIMAVVPDNRDPMLAVDAPAVDFWPRVRRWQAAGWTIALHGHQHLYTSRDGGIVGINAFSEFAGLPRSQQAAKLEQALSIFAAEGVRADAWVAPAHSFDATTIELLLGAGIRVVSDGFYPRAVRHLGAVWVPQQLWRFRPMPAGLWTVCHHHNGYDDSAMQGFERQIALHSAQIVALPAPAELDAAPRRGIADMAFAAAWRAALRFRRTRAPT